MKIINFSMGALVTTSVLVVTLNATASSALCVDEPTHGELQSVVGIIPSGGSYRVWGGSLSCAVAHSPTQILQWVGRFTGPAFAVVPTVSWTSALTGCTASAVVVANQFNAATSTSIAAATATMTSTECRGTFSFTLTAGTITITSLFPVNIRVEQAPFMFLCAAAGISANAYTPSANTCMDPSIRNYECDSTTATTTPIPASECTPPPGSTVNTYTNVTVAPVTVNATTNVTVESGNGTVTPKIEWSLYILFLAFAVIMSWMADQGRDYLKRVFAGILYMITAFIGIWEQSEIGFDQVPRLVLVMLFLLLIFGITHLIPRKHFQEGTK